MAFPAEVLSEQEEVVLHLRPHGKSVVGPVLVLVLTLAGLIMAWVLLPGNEGGRIGLALVAAIMLYHAVRYGVHPIVQWRCTHYVLTGERLLTQSGILVRERRDLPLNRVNDHALTQSLLDRVFGTGTLVIDSIGEQSARLSGVPHAQRVQTTLYELIELSPDEDEEEDAEVSA
ncbi:membrane protein [Actinoplanes ianthinogenes]|uniref:Membrane protein n=1 Tax=Actinoplanes ianthinogenes TaxID=122358 RepID=A0ABN6CEX4_9ACTN|nr:PH domain-containing protein [Actinoplanes ianthinogenes]BCJ42911.1 membrane protein [Actinoplanes ianthinogenes]GGQ91459.1 membrane protein [Actinoplanes ianthinogenes]